MTEPITLLLAHAHVCLCMYMYVYVAVTVFTGVHSLWPFVHLLNLNVPYMLQYLAYFIVLGYSLSLFVHR